MRMNGIRLWIICDNFLSIISRVNSHNQGATDKITKDVIESGECSCRDSIACKMMVLLIKAELLMSWLQMLLKSIMSTL